MSSMLDNSDLFPIQTTKGIQMTRITQQLITLESLEPTISNAGKITITPTRIRIMSEHKAGAAFDVQHATIQAHLGLLPFHVELVPHG